MNLEYINGVRITKLAHEKNRFEQKLDDYVYLAKKHFAEFSSSKNQQERKNELQKSLQFLAHERRLLATIAEVQAQLDIYRETGLQATRGNLGDRQAALAVLRSENHHPAGTLAKLMAAEGEPKPSPLHTAHHIVPGKGKLRVLMNQLRVHLHLHGIRINDPANGVYLLTKDGDAPHWSMPNSRGHLRYHTHDYEKWINSRLSPLRHIDFLKTHLQIIGRILQENEPKNATKK